MTKLASETKKTHGYAPVNGLNMYYEIEGSGAPLVFIPPAFWICRNEVVSIPG